MARASAAKTSSSGKKKSSTTKATSAKRAAKAKAGAKKKSATKSPRKSSTRSKTSTKKANPKRSSAKSSSTTKSSQPKVAEAEVSVSSSESAALQSDWEWPGSQVRRSLGAALLGLAGAGKFASGDSQVMPGPGGELPGEPVVDVALGALDIFLAAGERMTDVVRDRLNTAVADALGPASDSVSGMSGTGLDFLGSVTGPLAERGRRLRADSEHEAAAAVAAVLPETIELAMTQIDLTELAINHMDLERLLEAAVEQVDMTQFAIDHMDLPRLVAASLEQVDLTEIAMDKVDFAKTLPMVMDQVDVIALVREQIDPAKLAAFIRDNVDLSEAIRTTPQAVAGEAVRGVTKRARRIVGGTDD